MNLPENAHEFMRRFGLAIPLIQAPMAGVSTPELAAAVCNSGAIGSLGVGAASVNDARALICKTKALTTKPFNINFFCHRKKIITVDEQITWQEKLKPLFHEFLSEPPEKLHEPYDSFYGNDALLAMVLAEKPAIASFHFGLPDKEAIRALKAENIYLMASVTSLQEAHAAEKMGMDALIAQGIEAGGHRGIFDENGTDDQLGLFALVNLLAKDIKLPIIAAGGIMNGQGICAALSLGASAAQMGTAFIACPESAADTGYREKLISKAAFHTIITRAISGRPARALESRFTIFGETIKPDEIPPYPFAYDAGKQLHALAKTYNKTDFGAYWAGQGAPLVRALPAANLIKLLQQEFFFEK